MMGATSLLPQLIRIPTHPCRAEAEVTINDQYAPHSATKAETSFLLPLHRLPSTTANALTVGERGVSTLLPPILRRPRDVLARK